VTTSISITGQPVTGWCPVCLRSWTPDMVPVKVKFHWHYETICGQCAREIGMTARKEQRKRRREKEILHSEKGQGQ